MKTILKLMMAVAIILQASSCAQNAKAQDLDPYTREVEKLMTVTDSKQLMKTGMITMWNNLHLPLGDTQKLADDVVDDIWTDYVKECSLIYQKYLTLDDLKAINAFYETPAGSKLAKCNNTVLTECSQMINQKFRSRVEKIIENHLNH